MIEKSLIVLDSLDSGWIDWARSAASKGTDLPVLTLGLSNEAVAITYEQALADLPQVRFLDTHELSKKAEAEIRQAVPPLMGKIQEVFREELNSGTQNYWKYLEFSEKSIWSGTLIHHLFALCRLDQVLAGFSGSFRVCLALRDQELACTIESALKARGVPVVRLAAAGVQAPPNPRGRFLRAYWKRVVQTGLNSWIKKFLFAKAGNESTAENASAFFTLYPLFWSAPLTQPIELFFQGAPDVLAREQPVYYLAWLPGITELWKDRAQIRRVFADRRIIPIEPALRLRDFFSLFDLGIAKRASRMLRRLWDGNTISFRDYDISRLAYKDVFKSWTSPEFPKALLLEKSLQRALKRRRPRNLIYRLEFKPFENAVLCACKGLTRTVGFQHSAISQNFLTYVFEPGALAEKDALAPDHILTTGLTAARLLSRAGIGPDRLTTIGPLRYAPLLDYIRDRVPRARLREQYSIPQNKRVIFVAASLLREETLSMMTALFKAVEGDGQQYFVILRCHPSVAMGAVFEKQLGKIFGPDGYRILEGKIPIYDTMSTADVLLLTGSTVGVEAVALGVVPIVYECPAQFGNNPLTEIPASALFVRDFSTLRSALQTVFSNGDEIQNLRGNWPAGLNEVFFSMAQDPKLAFVTTLRQIQGVDGSAHGA